MSAKHWGKDSSELLGSDEVQETLASHNHYVNIAVNAGVLGWVVGLWFFVVLWRMHRISVERYRCNRPAYIRHCGITLALLAALMNAFFTTRAFSPDLMTCFLVGLLIADYRLSLRDGPRQEVVNENEAGGDGTGACELNQPFVFIIGQLNQPAPAGARCCAVARMLSGGRYGLADKWRSVRHRRCPAGISYRSCQSSPA